MPPVYCVFESLARFPAKILHNMALTSNLRTYKHGQTSRFDNLDLMLLLI